MNPNKPMRDPAAAGLVEILAIASAPKDRGRDPANFHRLVKIYETGISALMAAGVIIDDSGLPWYLDYSASRIVLWENFPADPEDINPQSGDKAENLEEALRSMEAGEFLSIAPLPKYSGPPNLEDMRAAIYFKYLSILEERRNQESAGGLEPAP